MVVGATSGAGKTTVVTALCRALARRSVPVSPFKAQNMSNHSAVTPDGGEIGRAQAMQALAAGVETDRRMGPVLLKPSGPRSSDLVVLGQQRGLADAVGYGARARRLRPVVLQALQSLRADHEVVLLEGAGGAGEINLLDRDLVNLPLAAAAGLPAILVVDIERGGAFASAYGTWALLPPELRGCLRGFIINGFRGEESLLADGIRDLESRTGVPVLGVLPHLGDHVMLGQEDSLGLDAHVFGRRDPRGSDRPVRVAVIRLPQLANPADLDPLILEPSVQVRPATVPADLTEADLIILPGSRATVADLDWLRRQGLAEALTESARRPAGPTILGLGAGYQMLGERIVDDVESGRGAVPGLGLLPVTTTLTTPQVVARARGWVRGAPQVTAAGYEIRWGRPHLHGRAEPWLELTAAEPTDTGATVAPWSNAAAQGPRAPGPHAQGGRRPEGCRRADGRVLGTSLHGILDEDSLRRQVLTDVAEHGGRDLVVPASGYAQALQDHLEHLADWAEAHLDVPALLELARTAVLVDEAPGW